jgi:hypothetical protein
VIVNNKNMIFANKNKPYEIIEEDKICYIIMDEFNDSAKILIRGSNYNYVVKTESELNTMTIEEKKELLKGAKTAKIKSTQGFYDTITDIDISDKRISCLGRKNVKLWFELADIEILEIDGKPIGINELDEISNEIYHCNFDNLNTDNHSDTDLYAKHYCLKQLESKLNGGILSERQCQIDYIPKVDIYRISGMSHYDWGGIFNFNLEEIRDKFISIVGTERLTNFLKEFVNIGY